MIKGVIFDVDGTILDSMPLWSEAGSLYLKKYGIQTDQKIAEKMFEMTLSDGAVLMKEHFHLADDPATIIKEILDIVKDGYAHSIPAKEGMVDLIKDLRKNGIRLTVVSAGVQEFIELAFRRLGILDCFDAIYSGMTMKRGKDDPHMFLEAAATMGCKNEETAVIDDGLYAIRTAKKEGFRTIGIYDPSGDAFNRQLQEESHLYIYRTKELTKERIMTL